MDGMFIRTNSADFKGAIKALMEGYFGIAHEYVDKVLGGVFDSFTAHLKDDLMAYIEPVYVDKVYRDSYYSYYASKSTELSKNCIRISFFEDDTHQIQENELDYGQYDYLKQQYRGFVVLRPTMINVIGRNAISPLIVKHNDFSICKTRIDSTVGGFKFSVEAFPAASQDSETMTCAETTVWSMMEYFGNRYPEYSPLLPSNILNILKQTTIERQLPSNGLTEDNLSYIAKSCGFGPKLYHRDFFPDFDSILSCYIESGIPVMVALSNLEYLRKEIETGTDTAVLPDYLGHAVMCVGHENIREEQIDNTRSQGLGGLLNLLDYDDIEKKFVFIDDNCPPYMMDSISSPTGRYAPIFGMGQDWEHCKIDHFVAPLYKKVYLDPQVAKGYLKELLCSTFMPQVHGKEITLRVFLCSTRSYRDYVNRSSMSVEMKRMVANQTLPRFVWVAEISDRDSLKRGVATGVILLDATEYKTEYHNALLVSFCGGQTLFKENGSVIAATIRMHDFKMYKNLK